VPDWLVVLILALVEGITEFIPVSSTGHLLLVEQMLPNGRVWLENDLFNIVIQSAAVLAVIPLFRARLTRLAHWSAPDSRDYLLKLATAFAITAAGGVVLDKLHFKLPETVLPIALALLAGGVAFLLIEWRLRDGAGGDDVTWLVAGAVGAGQLLAAVFPGASRSGTTILLCLLLGLRRPAATEFCFLVGIPTMLAAGGWKILKVLRHQEAAPDWGMVLLGSAASAAVSFLAVKWLLRYVQTHTFVMFGWYRIALGTVLLALLLLTGGPAQRVQPATGADLPATSRPPAS
jgi:undecaprenyl-diphosphatase